VIVGFETGEGRIEHFPARHDDDVKAGSQLVAPEHLARQAFGAIAFDSGADFSCRRNAEPRCRPAIRQNEQSHEPAMDPGAVSVDALELGPAADTLRGCKPIPGHRTC
jgi:hypothetical protein